jgi:hypothetical protein
MSALGDGSSAFSRALASNSRKQRDIALFALKQWLGARSSVEETDLLKLWKGLFYAMWHADKAPVQAEVAENMAAVLDACQPEVRLRWAPLPPLVGLTLRFRASLQVALAYLQACMVTLRCVPLKRTRSTQFWAHSLAAARWS